MFMTYTVNISFRTSVCWLPLFLTVPRSAE